MGKYLEQFVQVISATHNTGKTTTLVNLACAVAELGKKVLIVDFSNTLQTGAQLLSLDDRVVYSIDSLLSYDVPLQKVAIPFKKNRNLAVFPFSPALLGLQKKPEELLKLVNVFRKRFDYIFADMPNDFYLPTLELSDQIIIVSDPTKASLSGTSELLHSLDTENKPTKVIINKITATTSLSKIANQIDSPLLGSIPLNEPEMNASIVTREPVYMNKAFESAHSFDRLALNFINNAVADVTKSKSDSSDDMFKKIFNQSSHFKLS